MNIFKTGLMALAALSLVSVGYAQSDSGAGGGGAAGASGGGEDATWTVTSADATSGQVTAESKGMSKTVTVADPSRLKDVKPGDKIQVKKDPTDPSKSIVTKK
jgi:hypothetical protein